MTHNRSCGAPEDYKRATLDNTDPVGEGCELAIVGTLASLHGKARALLALDRLRMVLVKVEPPRDCRAREKLRHILEGVIVTEGGRRRRSRGLVERLGGWKVAPWVYLVPRTRLQELGKTVKTRGGSIETIYDPTTTAITMKQKGTIIR